jgi:hypothetical protein
MGPEDWQMDQISKNVRKKFANPDGVAFRTAKAAKQSPGLS